MSSERDASCTSLGWRNGGLATVLAYFEFASLVANVCPLRLLACGNFWEAAR